jgi:hypothetical protein
MSVLARIAAERQRQVSLEGYSQEHDDQHDHGELAMAAIAYASPIAIDGDEENWTLAVIDQEGVTEPVYPFGNYPHKLQAINRGQLSKEYRIQQLIIAGALLVAEVERLERIR